VNALGVVLAAEFAAIVVLPLVQKFVPDCDLGHVRLPSFVAVTPGNVNRFRASMYSAYHARRKKIKRG
jgi:hypothetical protein